MSTTRLPADPLRHRPGYYAQVRPKPVISCNSSRRLLIRAYLCLIHFSLLINQFISNRAQGTRRGALRSSGCLPIPQVPRLLLALQTRPAVVQADIQLPAGWERVPGLWVARREEGDGESAHHDARSRLREHGPRGPQRCVYLCRPRRLGPPTRADALAWPPVTPPPAINMSHVITEFSFGPYFPEITQPLDNSFEITPSRTCPSPVRLEAI